MELYSTSCLAYPVHYTSYKQLLMEINPYLLIQQCSDITVNEQSYLQSTFICFLSTYVIATFPIGTAHCHTQA